MTTPNPFASEEAVESAADGGTWLLDLVAAVDHLRRGLRPGLTVWDALEEAIRTSDPVWDDPDPLRSTLADFLAQTSGAADLELQGAVRRWVLAAGVLYNDGHHWPHPLPRRGFPPPSMDKVTVDA